MEWFTSSELVGTPGLPTTDRQIRNIIKTLSDEVPEKVRQRQGSKANEIHISLLSPTVQAALLRRYGKVQLHDRLIDLPKGKGARYSKEALWAKWNQAGAAAQAKAKEKLEAVMAIQRLIDNGVAKMDAFAGVAREFDVPQPTVMRWHYGVQAFDQADWQAALLPRHRESAIASRSKRLAEISPEAWEAFKADYLRLEKPTFAASYYRLCRIGEQKGWVIPSESALRRRLNFEICQEQQVLLREGEHALHQMYPTQERTVADLQAMEWITGDGYQHNVFVKWWSGEVLRPKTWFWMDVYSRKILAWRTDVSENTDSIRLSLMDVCRDYGIPRELTIDNTRAAANKWMTGGVPNRYRFKVKEDDPTGIIPMLGIQLHWTSVILGKGHGQAKPIERAFGVGGLEEFIDKHPSLLGAYTGPNPMAKPENYGSQAVDVETFLAAVAEGVEMYNRRPERETEVCNGVMSFDEAFEASYRYAVVRRAVKEQLQLLMLQAEAVRVSRHGTITLEAGGCIASRKNRYACPALYQYIDKKVVARFDPAALHEAVLVYTLDGVLIGEAPCLDKVAFGDTQEAREHKRRRTQFVKATKAAAKAQLEMDALEVAAMMPGASDHTPPESKVVEVVRAPAALGNTALAHAVAHQAEPELDLEQRYSESVALLREQAAARRL